MARAGFLDMTLLSAAHVAEQSLFSEAYANRHGLLQALDVRIKLVGFLSILVLASFLRTPQMLWLLYGLGLVLAALSRVPLGLFMKRVWLFVPLFSAAIVLPAVLNIVTPGDPVLVLVKLHGPHTWGPYAIPAEISITRQGLWGGIVFVSRVAASVSFAVLFTLTSKWADIFAGLRTLFVPRVFVMTLSMTYRYLFVFLRLVRDMYLGRKSRTIRRLPAAAERSWIASRIGVTYKKAVDMSEDIYRAMLSRGFYGEFRRISRFHASVADYIWLMTVLCFGGILIMVERGFLR